MKVHDLTLFSDQCMLVLRLGTYTYLLNHNMSNISNSEEFVSAPDKFTWSKNSNRNMKRLFRHQ